MNATERRDRYRAFSNAYARFLAASQEEVCEGVPPDLEAPREAAREVLENALPWLEAVAAFSECGGEALPTEAEYLAALDECKAWITAGVVQ